jgi:hypothetical protein
MAITINPTNINPNVGDVYAMRYKTEMAKLEPWMKARTQAIKDIGDVAKIAFMGKWGAASDAVNPYDQFDMDDGTIDEYDTNMVSSGIDPKLFNAMNRYNEATSNYRSMFGNEDLWGD